MFGEFALAKLTYASERNVYYVLMKAVRIVASTDLGAPKDLRAQLNGPHSDNPATKIAGLKRTTHRFQRVVEQHQSTAQHVRDSARKRRGTTGRRFWETIRRVSITSEGS